jgi:hypothetical protein
VELTPLFVGRLDDSFANSFADSFDGTRCG